MFRPVRIGIRLERAPDVAERLGELLLLSLHYTEKKQTFGIMRIFREQLLDQKARFLELASADQRAKRRQFRTIAVRAAHESRLDCR